MMLDLRRNLRQRLPQQLCVLWISPIRAVRGRNIAAEHIAFQRVHIAVAADPVTVSSVQIRAVSKLLISLQRFCQKPLSFSVLDFFQKVLFLFVAIRCPVNAPFCCPFYESLCFRAGILPAVLDLFCAF